jgi:hypothetical protein
VVAAILTPASFPVALRPLVWICLFAGLQAMAGAAFAEEQVTPHGQESSAATPHHSTSQKRPPSGMSPEEDLEYSRFMHHSSGVAVLIIAVLLLGDRATGHRYRLLRVGSGVTWLALGLFLFIYSDLEAWPIGPAGFIESFSLPTADEWIQHHLLSMIPMVLGVYTILCRWKESRALWSYVMAGLATLGGVALLIHQHLDHPDLDFVNIQHRFFAATVFVIAASLVVERSARFTWNGKPYLLPAGLLLLGIQLAVYVE